MQTIASTNQTALSRLPYKNSFCILQSSWKIWSTTTTNWIMFTTGNQNSVRQTFIILFCWSISREMFKGRSSKSTMPFTKPKYSGMISSQLSMIKTRRTYSLILFCFFRPSNISKGALLGTNNTDLNSNPQELCTSKRGHNYWNWEASSRHKMKNPITCPSTEKCLTARCSSQSFVKLL